MSPPVKYTLGRVGLFVVLALIMLLVPLPIDFYLRLLIALVISVPLQFIVLRRWRTEMIAYVDGAVARRRSQKEKLRAALAGDDESGG